MATAERNLFSDAQPAVRTGESAGRTHRDGPQKLPPMRTESSLAPYAPATPGTATGVGSYPEAGSAAAGAPSQETVRLQVIELMLVDIADSESSRAMIADAIGVSQPTLDSWLAKTRMDRMMPVAALPEWVKATGGLSVLAWAAAECGYELADTEQQRDAALGRLVRQARGLIEEVLTA